METGVHSVCRGRGTGSAQRTPTALRVNAQPPRLEWRGQMDLDNWESFELQFPERLNEEEMQAAAAIACYWARNGKITNGGNGVGYWRWTNQRTLWLEVAPRPEVADPTQGRLADLYTMLIEGTPARKREHAGKPVGSRAVNGIGQGPVRWRGNALPPTRGDLYYTESEATSWEEQGREGGLESILHAPRQNVATAADRKLLPEADESLKGTTL